MEAGKVETFTELNNFLLEVRKLPIGCVDGFCPEDKQFIFEIMAHLYGIW